MQKPQRSHRRTRALAVLAGSAVAALALVGCSPAAKPTPKPPSTATPSTTPSPSETATPTAPVYGPRQPTTGLGAPWSVAFVGNSAIVSERDSGRLLELPEDGSTRELTTLGDVVHGGEGGLLGIAVSPADQPAGDTALPEFLYAYSTGPGGNRVQRFPLTGEPGNLALGAAETILDGLPSAHSHNGGRIKFGPDGMLYVTVGDTRAPSLAQDVNALAGKILRLTPDGGIPADNPFPDSPVYSYGHRNPQGLAWGPDGTLYSSEFGEDTWDELNVITPGGNYGWPLFEGKGGEGSGFIEPVQQWHPADASPSGIAVVNDTIYIANLRGQRIRSVPLSDLGASTEHFVGEYGRLRDVIVAPDGRLWLLSNNTDGRVAPRDGDDRFIDTGLVG